jgi:hypothetical protein
MCLIFPLSDGPMKKQNQTVDHAPRIAMPCAEPFQSADNLSNHVVPAKNVTRPSLAIEFLNAHPLKTAKGGAPGTNSCGSERSRAGYWPHSVRRGTSNFSFGPRPVTAGLIA